MQELSFVGSDGDYVLLRASDGTQFRVLLDDELRSAVRREPISERDAALVSPREIQMQVRAGLSIDDLVANSGASREYVEKFALPVMDELTHVISRALSVRITMAGDRYSETTQVEFGEVIGNRLASLGVSDYRWSSRKGEFTPWELQCSYGDNLATWSFDPRQLTLAPENELAVQLSNTQVLNDGLIPKLRPVTQPPAPKAEPKPEPTQAPTPEPVAVVVTEPEPDTSPMSVVPEPPAEAAASTAQGSGFTNPLGSITEDLGNTHEFGGVVPFGRSKAPVAESEPVGDLANTADLLDALRKRRAQRERELNDAAAIAREQDLAAEELELLDSTSEDEATPETAPIDVAPESESESASDSKSKSKGRPSMPSWDEIVFGTRADDE